MTDLTLSEVEPLNGNLLERLADRPSFLPPPRADMEALLDSCGAILSSDRCFSGPAEMRQIRTHLGWADYQKAPNLGWWLTR